MLKRLELVGFKSFADKTQFDFAPGITGVVGPNGSGKSNVVDAVRWILGEQSAKSLRGGEMADVIFNGSSSRKSLGLAEVTITFDNARRLLAVDADEVQITRRVYRDGTGEYLINGQMSPAQGHQGHVPRQRGRAGGYSIIAQGRVDELLQASTKDRREIFDEAAGISRFKAKKIETLRKLAAVEAEPDAVEGPARRARHAAPHAATAGREGPEIQGVLGPAARVCAWASDVREYRELSAALDDRSARCSPSCRPRSPMSNRRTGELEQALRELDREVSRAEDGLRHQEGRLADAREQIAGLESTLKHERGGGLHGNRAAAESAGSERSSANGRRQLKRTSIRAAEEEQAAEANLTAVQQTADAEAAMLERRDRTCHAARPRGGGQSRSAIPTRRRCRRRPLDRHRLSRTGRTLAEGVHAQADRSRIKPRPAGPLWPRSSMACRVPMPMFNPASSNTRGRAFASWKRSERRSLTLPIACSSRSNRCACVRATFGAASRSWRTWTVPSMDSGPALVMCWRC